MTRFSTLLTTPLAVKLISFTLSLSMALTVTLREVRGSICAPAMGLVICTLGLTLSITITCLGAGSLSFPAVSWAVTLNVIGPGDVSIGTGSRKLASNGGAN